jgi:hypothetical protein
MLFEKSDLANDMFKVFLITVPVTLRLPINNIAFMYSDSVMYFKTRTNTYSFCVSLGCCFTNLTNSLKYVVNTAVFIFLFVFKMYKLVLNKLKIPLV